MEDEKTPSYKDIKHMLWREGDLAWKLDGLQEHISETIRASGSKKGCILSSRQIGKSFWAVLFALEFLIRNPGLIARVIAPTRTACDDIVNDNLTRILADAPEGMVVRKPGHMRWNIHTQGRISSLRVGALEREHVDKNRGGNASLVIYEECGFVKSDDFDYGVNSVLGPQLLRSKGMELFVSSPSVDPEHSLHTRIKPKAEALGTFFQYTVYDSPSITQAMIDEAIERCGGVDTDDFQREYMARIIRPSAFVCVPSYSEIRHCQLFEAPRVAHWQVMVDWGGVKDLTVALLHAYDFLGARHIVWDEAVFPPNTSTDVIAAGLKEWEAKWGFTLKARFGDVFPQTSIDLAKSNYQVRPPSKGPWLASVNTMAVKFSTNSVLIHPRCEFLRRSLRGGMFNKTKTDFERSAELGHCDALAALMYSFQNQDTSNPYTDRVDLPESVFVLKPQLNEAESLKESFSIKQWGTQRTFGGFRK